MASKTMPIWHRFTSGTRNQSELRNPDECLASFFDVIVGIKKLMYSLTAYDYTTSAFHPSFLCIYCDLFSALLKADSHGSPSYAYTMKKRVFSISSTNQGQGFACGDGHTHQNTRFFTVYAYDGLPCESAFRARSYGIRLHA